jgi:DNA gyrase subunit B
MTQEIQMEVIEAVRKRPAMYVGSTSIRGFNHILKGLVKDIFKATEANYFSFELIREVKGKIVFKNFQKPISDNAALEFQTLNDPNFQGFELVLLNALSKDFEFRVFDKKNDELFQQLFEEGKLKKGKIENKTYRANGFEFTFDLDNSIFEISEPMNANFYLEQIRNLAYLHKGKILEVIYSVDDKISNSIFKFENGLKDKIEVEKLKGHCGTYFDTYIEKTIEDFTFEAAFCFRETPVDESFLISYANYVHTHENGTHVNAFIKGIYQAVEQYVLNKQLEDVKITSSKAIWETLVAAIHIKMEKPLFEGSVKNKLINTKIVSPIVVSVSEILLQKMENDQKSAENLLSCFRRFEWQSK